MRTNDLHIELPMSKSLSNRWLMINHIMGDRLLLRKLSTADGTTLVEVALKSGRKNQIRVHFSEAGHPVVGDVKYGGQKASRMYLHSAKLRFKHPMSGTWLEFKAERTLDGRRETERPGRGKNERGILRH